MFAKILGTTLAAAVFATALGGTALADTASAAPTAAVATDHTNQRAIDALGDVLNRMVDEGKLTVRQRDAVVEAVRRADWDGYSIERLGDILGVLVRHDIIGPRQRDLILDAVRHSERNTFRLAVVLDTLTDKGVLSRDQRDAIVVAPHRADWDGFSIDNAALDELAEDVAEALDSRRSATASSRSRPRCLSSSSGCRRGGPISLVLSSISGRRTPPTSSASRPSGSSG